jgi:hypothetical protein
MFQSLWIAILASVYNLAVKAFAQSLQVKPVQSQMGLKK